MSYVYETERPWVLTDEGQRALLKLRDWTYRQLKVGGSVRSQEMISHCPAGDTWKQLACVDRLVELGDLREVTPAGVAGQHRVFVSRREL